MRRSLLASVILLPALLASPAVGDQAVMADGRVLRVVEVQALGEAAWLLTLDGGGQISCARSRLVEVRPDPPPIEAPTPATATEAWRALAGGLEGSIERFSLEHGLEPELVVAVIQTESNFDRWALSPKGAQGLMQLMPATAADFAVLDPYDPEENLRGGTAYLGQLLRRFEGDLQKTLAAYNAGPAAVERHGGIPPFPETRDYVRRVLAHYARL
jgi:hypothetical protein